MLRYFFKLSIRNLFKNKGNSLVNIISLSLGCTIMLLISIYVQNELSVDSFHSREAQIYKLSYGNSSYTPGPLSKLLVDEFPEIENATHIETQMLLALSPVLNYQNQVFEIEKYYSADSVFFSIFDFKVLEGNVREALSTPFSIVLTENEAKRIFKGKSPIGEIVRWKNNKEFNFTVKAVVENLPQNSSIHFNGLISSVSIGKMGSSYIQDWGFTTFETYLLLKPTVNVYNFELKLRNSIIQYYKTNLSTKACADDARSSPIELHPLRKVYFSQLTHDTTNGGNILLVRVLIAIGIVIMLLSIINYVNLSTARASLRTKEIGVQKVVGCKKTSHVLQYLSETIIISFFAAIFSFLISLLLLEKFSFFMNLNEGLNFPYLFFFISFIPGILLLGIIAGIYPAFYITSQKTVDILKGKVRQQNNGIALRYALIVLQFTVTIALIASTFFIYKQVNYMKNKDMGIKTNQVLTLKLPFPIIAGKKEVFGERLRNIPEISKVSFSSTLFGKIQGQNSQEVEGKTVSFATVWTDDQFIDLFGMELLEGRLFSKDFETDINATAVLNQAAIKAFDLKNPFDMKIRIPGGEAKVIGVVKDFNYKSLHSNIEPLAILYLPSQGQYANIQLSGNFKQTINKIETLWDEMAAGFPINYQFLDDSFDNLYKKDEQMRKAITYFSFLAIAIAFLGIFGLSIFIAERRMKEIGVRKINGAKVWEILFLLNKDIAKNIVIAFIVATPIAWYAMHKWLENFAYKTELSWWIFALAGLLAFLIALLTVSWQSWRVATRNPVEALRYE